MKYQTDEENGRQVLRLEGDLGIEQAGELREIFIREMEIQGPLNLNLDGVKTAHVACLQILCSAHRTFWTSGQGLTLDGPLPPLFNQALEDAGFDREKGCPLDSTQTCLFASGGKR
jgi:anti-anti-sigma regulatory factor